MELPFFIDEASATGIILAKKQFFSREAILLVSEKFSPNFYVSFYPSDDATIKINLTPKNNRQIENNDLRAFMNELIDFQVRQDLQQEFGPIRNKIVEYAFSSVESI